jgi:hypothetical protein
VADSVVPRLKSGAPATSPVRVWPEMRAFLWVALSVFCISVLAQLFFISMVHYSVREFFSQARRSEMFLMTTCINLVNGCFAGYLACRMKLRERRWRARQQEVTGYLNHHVRNALSSIQYAAIRTNDAKSIAICNESVRRIVDALATAETGIPHNDEFIQFQERLKAS